MAVQVNKNAHPAIPGEPLRLNHYGLLEKSARYDLGLLEYVTFDFAFGDYSGDWVDLVMYRIYIISPSGSIVNLGCFHLATARLELRKASK